MWPGACSQVRGRPKHENMPAWTHYGQGCPTSDRILLVARCTSVIKLNGRRVAYASTNCSRRSLHNPTGRLGDLQNCDHSGEYNSTLIAINLKKTNNLSLAHTRRSINSKRGIPSVYAEYLPSAGWNTASHTPGPQPARPVSTQLVLLLVISVLDRKTSRKRQKSDKSYQFLWE